MKTYFEIISWFFFFLSVLVWLFFLRGNIIFPGNVYNIIRIIIVPWYLIITGLMVWYLVANIWIKKDTDETKVYTKSFIIGIIIWVILALAYMFI